MQGRNQAVIPVEICINADGVQPVAAAVAAAQAGGASTIELCGDMRVDGLTPGLGAIQAARAAFAAPGLMIMIRPRGGDFVYRPAEISRMKGQIAMAAEAGADGVVLGLLHGQDGGVDDAALAALMAECRSRSLQVTFHRAFDAAPDPYAALETLIALGVDRILTSGSPWGSGEGALEGLPTLQRLVEQADGRIEIVIGGGVTPANAKTIGAALPTGARIAFHAYSSVLRHAYVSAVAVRMLRCAL
jgi:copper homeostasis protein